MAVPEIKYPTVEAEQQPVVPTEAPPQQSFMGTAVGHGLSQIGEELYEVGRVAYHRGVVANAQEAETEFQKRALQIRDRYRNIYLLDAVKAHDGHSLELEGARREIAKSIPTKDGQALYMNSSLRTSRFVQESIDSHYEQQNRAYQTKTYTDWQVGQNTLLASKAADAKYSATDVQKIMQDKYNRAIVEATSHGADSESAADFAKREVQRGADSLFSILTHKNNPNREAAQAELEKYGAKGWVDKAGYKDVMNTINSSNSKAWARQQFVALPKEDGSHEPDPEGYVPHSAVQALIDKISADDPHKGEKSDALEQEYAVHRRSFDLAGHEMRNSIKTQGMLAGGGKFVIPTDSLDWQKFVRLHGDLADDMQAKQTGRDWASWHRGKMNAHEASREAVGAARYYLDRLSPEDQKQVSKAELDTLVDRSYHGPGQFAAAEDKAKLAEYLDRLKNGKTDPVERQFNQIATQALEEAYKGNRQLARAAMNRAYYFLDDTYNESVRSGKPLSTADLREKLVDEFKKKNGVFGTSMFGDRAGEGYQRKPKIQEFETGTDSWKTLKPGTRFRFKSDPAGKWRTR